VIPLQFKKKKFPRFLICELVIRFKRVPELVRQCLWSPTYKRSFLDSLFVILYGVKYNVKKSLNLKNDENCPIFKSRPLAGHTCCDGCILKTCWFTFFQENLVSIQVTDVKKSPKETQKCTGKIIILLENRKICKFDDQNRYIFACARTSVEAGHPLDLPDVGDLLAEQVGEHSDGNLHFAGVVESVVGLEHLGQVAGHAVRDEHDGLVATVAALATSAITILRPNHCNFIGFL
jgi:hypothetical protein